MSTISITDETGIKRSTLLRELFDVLQSAECRILGAKGVSGYTDPPFLHNEGYGDQQKKMPDLLGFDTKTEEFLIGIVRVTREELESEQSLNEYDVFFDQKDKNGKPYRVVIIVPSDYASEVTSIVTHYIHRELWHLLTIVASKALII